MLSAHAKHIKRQTSSSNWERRSPLANLFGNEGSETSSSSQSSSGGTTSSQNAGNTGNTGGGNTGSATTGSGNEAGNGNSASSSGGLNGGSSSSSTNSGSQEKQPSNNTPVQHTFTSSSSLAPTSTSSMPPSSTMTSSSATSTMTSMPPPTSTSSTLLPSSTHVTSVTSNGQVVVVTSTISGVPAPTSVPSGTISSHGEESSGPNVGAIIGGLAGGLVGLIVLIWLILLPVRARAKRKQEVDWLSFKPDTHEANDDHQNDSIFRTPRAGVGEEDDETVMKRMNSTSGMLTNSESYQMQDVGQGGMTLYGHLDGNPRQQWQGQGGQMDAGNANATEYMNNQGGYDPNYHGYYNALYPPNTPAGFNMYSPHTSPEMGPAIYRGGGNVSIGRGGPGGPPGQPSPYGTPTENSFQNYNYPNMPPTVAPIAQRPNPHSQSNPSLPTSPSSEVTAAQATSLSRNASVTATAVSHGGGGGDSRGGIMAGGAAIGPSNSGSSQIDQTHKQTSSSVTSPTLQRRESGKLLQATNKSEEDVCLPYERESPARSANSIQQQKNLHLVNHDD